MLDEVLQQDFKWHRRDCVTNLSSHVFAQKDMIIGETLQSSKLTQSLATSAIVVTRVLMIALA
jgi:hypothetical protein